MSTERNTSLDSDRDRALEVRALCEVMERRLNGKDWSTQGLMLDMSEAFNATMAKLKGGLKRSVGV